MIDRVRTIYELTEKHHAWRRSCLNLVAAEAATSPLVETLLASDFSRRYSSKGVYAGDKYFVQIYEIVTELAKSLFGAKYAELRPVTGNMTVLACVTGLTQPGDTIMTIGPIYGGYPLRMAEWAGISVIYHPFDPVRMNIKVEQAYDKILTVRPTLIVFGASEYLFPHPVEALAEAAREVGATIYYDGSHVMGLIAGSEFQDPFSEGANLLAGSTHKTLPGPQRGLILTNDEEIYEKISNVFDSPPFLQSCYHLNTLVALGVALAECKQFGQQFATQIVKNARALAKALDEEGVSVLAAEYGYTRSHQVILENEGFASPRGFEIKAKLEECGILVDAVVRLGVQEVTRLGMKEAEMQQIASLIADVIQERRPTDKVREDARGLAANHRKMHFSFQDGEETGALGIWRQRRRRM